MMRHSIKFIPLTYIFLLVSLLTGCQGKNNGNDSYVKETGMIWNTVYHITYRGPESLRDSILPVLDEVGKSLSVFDPASTVSKINDNTLLKADSHFTKVFNVAKRIAKESDGAFDPTLSPLITAWGFGKGHRATSDTLRIDSMMQFVGFDKININNGNVEKKDPRVSLNLSAIAKGYGCDAVAAMFRRNGVNDYMIEIGGEIVAGGKSPRTGKWNIGIEKPEFNESEVLPSIAVVEITGCGMATSGNYRNFHKENGNRFGHTISPATGRPVQTDILSVTILAPTCTEADGFATACMVMGSEKAKSMIERLRLPALMVLNDTTVWTSEAMRPLLGEEGKDIR